MVSASDCLGALSSGKLHWANRLMTLSQVTLMHATEEYNHQNLS
jgi:hypothetical protein